MSGPCLYNYYDFIADNGWRPMLKDRSPPIISFPSAYIDVDPITSWTLKMDSRNQSLSVRKNTSAQKE